MRTFILSAATVMGISSISYASNILDINGVLVDSEGKKVYLKQRDAMQACESLGMHLPTIRELIVQFNPGGIKKTEEWARLDESEMYQHDVVSAANPDFPNPWSTIDRFLNARLKYKKPSIENGEIPVFWSSSANTGVYSKQNRPHYNNHSEFLKFDIVNGRVIKDSRGELGLVRCAPGDPFASARARLNNFSKKILRDENGIVRKMTRVDAIKACAKQGMHLPTIRELAVLFQPLGLRLAEISEISDKEVDDYVQPISAIDLDGKSDNFYIDSYRSFELNDLQTALFWSESTPSDSPNVGYAFNSYRGLATGWALDDQNAVICAAGPR